MLVETLSTFPDMFESVMGSSIMKRAQDKGILTFKAYDLRAWTHDVHRTTDDSPYGGGQGLVMKCDPIFEAYNEIVHLSPNEEDRSSLISEENESSEKPYVVFMTPVGETFNDQIANELAEKSRILFVCGHYEGIDERAYTLADRRISIGDYVLTGGELASMVVIDAVVRKVKGVLGDDNSAVEDSFSEGLLEYPH